MCVRTKIKLARAYVSIGTRVSLHLYVCEQLRLCVFVNTSAYFYSAYKCVGGRVDESISKNVTAYLTYVRMSLWNVRASLFTSVCVRMCAYTCVYSAGYGYMCLPRSSQTQQNTGLCKLVKIKDKYEKICTAKVFNSEIRRPGFHTPYSTESHDSILHIFLKWFPASIVSNIEQYNFPYFVDRRGRLNLSTFRAG